MHEILKSLKLHDYVENWEPYYRGDLGIHEKEIEAYYGICNTYFLLENGNILEVVSNYDWKKFNNMTKYCGICNNFGCTVDDLGIKVWNNIVDRAVQHFTEAVKDNITIKYHLMRHKPVPMSCVPQMFENGFYIYEKDNISEFPIMFENDVLYKNEEEAFPDVMRLYFNHKIAHTRIEKIFCIDRIRYYWFSKVLQYCSDNNIDISDLIQYQSVNTCIDRSDVIIYVSKEMLDNKHKDLNCLLNNAVNTYKSYAESKKLTVNVYDKTGKLIKTETGFVGEYIDEAGIEERFGNSKLKLGSYENLNECISANTKT